ncbi:hypothetical protein SAMN04488101_10334 [Pedobacter nyackensis]|uniref:Uncharacterized protein n=2 Tax=Pedobacter nyackensis TaxID=475255 RepID=A0A1W2C1M2_9SPHI|nr:hypothetical protein SAMN04488101_10334 [Pedobacter nyackensis]
MVLLLSGCALFKNTSKTNVKEIQQFSKEVDFREFVLKSGTKETQVFSYRNDSGFYQYQRIMEQVDQSASRELKTGEEALVKKELLSKKTEPPEFLGWFVVMLISMLCYLLYRRFYR